MNKFCLNELINPEKTAEKGSLFFAPFLLISDEKLITFVPL